MFLNELIRSQTHKALLLVSSCEATLACAALAHRAHTRSRRAAGEPLIVCARLAGRTVSRVKRGREHLCIRGEGSQPAGGREWQSKGTAAHGHCYASARQGSGLAAFAGRASPDRLKKKQQAVKSFTSSSCSSCPFCPPSLAEARPDSV